MGSDTPRTRAIGSTFQFTFILPKPANSGNTRPKKPKHTKPGRKTRAGTANHKSDTKPAKPRLTEEQKRELRRVLEVWPESHWPGFALRQADVFQSYTA